MSGHEGPSYHRGWHDGFVAATGGADPAPEAIEVVAQELAERYGDVLWADLPSFAKETWRWEAKDVLAGLVAGLRTPQPTKVAEMAVSGSENGDFA